MGYVRGFGDGEGLLLKEISEVGKLNRVTNYYHWLEFQISKF